MKKLRKLWSFILVIALSVTLCSRSALADNDVYEAVDEEVRETEYLLEEAKNLEADSLEDLSQEETADELIIEITEEEEIVIEEADAAAPAGQKVQGTFTTVAGYDIATIRYYTDENRSAYAFADFTYNQTTGSYEYSFTVPYDGFTSRTSQEFIGGSQADPEATVIAEYYDTTVWDGAVDVSWYNETSASFSISTPAQFAGLAAIVNGSLDSKVKDYMVKGERIPADEQTADYTYAYDLRYIVSSFEENGSLAAGGTGPIHMGIPEHDFAGRTITIANDLNMGGADGSSIDHSQNTSANSYSYPNWMCIGGQMLADVSDKDTMVEAYFNGVIEGNGHKIENLYCYRWAYKGVHGDTLNDDFAYAQGTGLVGIMGLLYSGEGEPSLAPAIRNLSLSGYIFGRRMVGGIVGCIGGGSNSLSGNEVVSADICIENVANHAYVYCTDSKGLGGIAGIAMARGSIINCYNDGYICAYYPAPTGGIIGSNEGMDLYCCYNTGTINSNRNTRGRGIGSNGDAGRAYTVNNCYYRNGCGDDPSFPGYYTQNMGSDISVTTEGLNTADLTNGRLLSLLNVNGNAYVEGTDGYPVLFWEVSGFDNCSVSLTQKEGGSFTASSEGQLPRGSIIYLNHSSETGWNFRYYTWNGRELTGDYAFVDGSGDASIFFESAKAGVLKIADSSCCQISVTKNGMVIQDGETISVEDYPVNSGDPLYEGDLLIVNADLKQGAVPDDEDLLYKAETGLANPYRYIWTYSSGSESAKYAPTYTVTNEINADDVSLFLTVEPQTTQKLWSYAADTSWYSDSASSFVLSTAEELAGLEVLVNGGNSFAGKTVKLGNDIDLTNNDGTKGNRFWDGIGTSATTAFAGTFDGQGYSITSFHANKNGLFAYCSGESSSSKAVIRNLSIYGDVKGAAACGLVSQAQNLTISNVSCYCVIESTATLAAGLVGIDNGATSIDNCFNYGDISGTGNKGGIAAVLSKTGSVSNCINYGAVTSQTAGYFQVGGLVGTLGGSLSKSANYGAVTAAGRNCGGLAGQMTETASLMTDCYNIGSVTYQNGSSNLDSVGGLVGYGMQFTIKNCFNYGSVQAVSGSSYIGGLIGRDARKQTSTTSSVYYLTSACSYAENATPLESLPEASYSQGMNKADETAFASASGVLAAINGNKAFRLNNGTYPELALTADTHVHSGGGASCTALAVCESCHLKYGGYDSSQHLHTSISNRSDAIWNQDGNTGDTICDDCKAVLTEGSIIPADTSRETLKVTVRENGKEDVQKTYTVAEFDALKQTSPVIAYQYGGSSKTMMVSDSYVTIEKLLSEFQLTYEDIQSVNVICEGADRVLTAETLTECCYSFDANGKASAAPAAICISYGTGTGEIEELTEVTKLNDSLRFGYGISQKQYDEGTSLGGKRMVSPLNEIVIQVKTPEPEEYCVSGSITGYKGTTEATIELFAASSSEALYTTTGKSRYSLEAVAPGSYTLKISAPGGYVTHSYSIKVAKADLTKNLELRLKGDVTRDGKINMDDASLIVKHLSHEVTITNAYVLKLADTDGSGAVSMDDSTRIAKYVVHAINEL